MAEYLLRSTTDINQNISLFLIDIPLNLTTAYAYLARIFGSDNVVLIKTIDELNHIDAETPRVWLIPSAFIESINIPFDIVNNAQSFSEMDFDTVDFYIKNLLKNLPTFFIETNVNVLGSENYGGHREVVARDFPIPDSHTLLTRFSAPESWSRYTTSIYMAKSAICNNSITG